MCALLNSQNTEPLLVTQVKPWHDHYSPNPHIKTAHSDAA